MNKELNIKFKFDNNPDNSIYILENYVEDERLLKEILLKNRIQWHTHTIVENPESITLFNELINKISREFNVIPTKTRINYFEKNTIKEYHKDFYKQDFTIVLNFHYGHVLFKHDTSDNVMKFSIEPNTLYIFDKYVNECWKHRVEVGETDRISIVIWGKKCI